MPYLLHLSHSKCAIQPGHLYSPWWRFLPVPFGIEWWFVVNIVAFGGIFITNGIIDLILADCHFYFEEFNFPTLSKAGRLLHQMNGWTNQGTVLHAMLSSDRAAACLLASFRCLFHSAYVKATLEAMIRLAHGRTVLGVDGIRTQTQSVDVIVSCCVLCVVCCVRKIRRTPRTNIVEIIKAKVVSDRRLWLVLGKFETKVVSDCALWLDAVESKTSSTVV